MRNTMHKFAPVAELHSEAKVCSKIAKAGPGYDVRPEHPPVQINSSNPCSI